MKGIMSKILTFVLSLLIALTMIPNYSVIFAEDVTTAGIDQQSSIEQQADTDEEQDAGAAQDAGATQDAAATDTETGSQTEKDQAVSDDTSVSEESDVSDEADTDPDEDKDAVKQEVDQKDAESSDKEEEVEQEDEEETYPAVNFERSVSGMTVKVTAPEGALPEGADVSITSVSKADVKDSVSELMGEDIDIIKAVDITFYDKDGKEIEPKKNVSVRFVCSKFEGLENPDVVHIKDNGAAEKLSGSKVDVSGKKVVFSSKDFSIYVITDENGDQTYRRTYKFLNEIDAEGNADAYEFYNEAGEKVDNQIIKNGDELEDVGTPRQVGKKFLGWYLVTESDGKYEYTDTEVEFETAISLSLTEDETVYVAPKYEAVYYVTFHETTKGSDDDIIQTKKVVYTSGSDANKVLISDVIAPQQDETHIFYGWILDDTTYNIYDSQKQVVETYIENIESDIDLYPNFVEAYWLRFVSAPHGASATHIESQFVLADESLTTLPVPERKGYTFAGWYTGSQDDQGEITYDEQISDGSGEVVVSGGFKLTEETTLYGKWTANEGTLYNVVFWKQKVTDDKNAATSEKTYDYWDSDVRTGTTDEAATITDADKTRTAKGFHYGRYNTTSETIAADGSTTINVYYDRDLVSVNFYYRSQDGAPEGAVAAYVYTETTSDSETPQQYGVLSDGSYVELVKTGSSIATRVFYTYGRRQTEYTGTFYTRHWVGGFFGYYEYTATEYSGDNLPPDDGVEYYALTGYDWWGDPEYEELTRRTETTTESNWAYILDGETIPYTGTRYTRRATSGYSMVTYTGLYGQNFSKYGYEWPAGYVWNEQRNGEGTTQTFMTDFTNESTAYNLYSQGRNGNYSIYHYRQTLDGDYSEDDRSVAHTTSSSSNFHFQNKFDGFTVVGYSNSFHTSGGTHAVSEGDVESVNYPIHVYHARNKWQIDYKVDGEVVHSESGIYFGANLTNYDITEADWIPEKEHYTFTGWYADETCTKLFDFDSAMPNANLVLYAGYEAERYEVKVDPAGGVITSDIGATYFEANYGEKINRYEGVKREYLEDAEGTYKYVINFTSTARSATYEIAEDGYTGTKYRKMTSADPVYKLIGWYEVVDGKVSSKPYDFDTPVDHDTTIQAKWQLSGGYKLQYNATMPLEDGNTVSGTFTQTDPDAQYADLAETIIQASPTDVTEDYVFDGWEVVKDTAATGDSNVIDDNDGNYYQTGDELILHAAWANSNKQIHLRAHYTKVDSSDDPVAVTKLIFDANGGTLTAAPSITDKNGNTCAPAVTNNVATYSGLPINQDYDLDQMTKKVTKSDAVLIGWNTSKTAADQGTVEFKTDVVIGVDELDSNANTLYAVWNSELKITIKNKTDSTYNGSEQAGYAAPKSVTGTGSDIDEDEYKVVGLVEDDVLTISGYTPSEGTNVGTYSNGSFSGATIKITRKITSGETDVTSNYNITTTAGELTIGQAKLTIKANDQTYIYNGEAQGEGDTAYEDPAEIAEKVTAEGLKGSDEITSIILDGQRKDVGEEILVVSSAAIGNATGNYNITYVEGKLTIIPKAVTVTAEDKSKVYGEDDPELTATVEGLIEGEDESLIEYDISREKGEEVGDYKITPAGDKLQGNYEVTYVEGTFTIEPKPADLTYKLNGGTYDGSTEDIVETYNVGDVIEIHAAPTREGYTFVEWRGSSYQPGDKYTVEGDHTFTAIWKKNAEPDPKPDPEKPDKPDKPEKPDTPVTGDDSTFLHWILLMLTSSGIMCILWTRRREEN